MKFNSKNILGILFGLTIIIGSCDNDEESIVTITGTVKYLETNLELQALPIRLSIYDMDKPIDRQNPGSNRVFKENGVTNNDGVYIFSLNRSLIPPNAIYGLTIEVDSLLIANEITPCFLPASVRGSFSTNSVIIRDILIDYPTYLHITFDKLNHSTNDRVRFLQPHCSLTLFETTLDRPDTTILETLYFQYFKKVDVKYYILKENEEEIEFVISDVPLVKNDTTKLTIEY
jgi:hypothetical protein